MKNIKRGIFLFLAVGLLFGALCYTYNQKERSATAGTEERLRGAEFVLEYRGKSWRLGAQELAVRTDIHTVLIDMFWREGYRTYEQKLDALERIERMGFEQGVGIRYLFPCLEQRIERICAQIERQPTPATIDFHPVHGFDITREVDGVRVDRVKLMADLERQFRRTHRVRVQIPTVAVKSGITAQQLQNATYLRSKFSTGYAQSSYERKHNIELAMSKLNGMRIDSGCELSFNRVVGRRTAANGFLEAKIILNGAFENGYGGGVCQSSTTLYNAALLADMEIVSAHQHSLQVGYVEPSFDAMVNSSGGDLVIKNTSSLPMFVRAYGDGERACVEIYGEKPTYKIVRISKVISKIAPPKDKYVVDTKQKYIDKAPYKGNKVRVQNAKEGIKSEGYLAYYDQSGRLIKQKLIRKNTYAPIGGIIAEGIIPPIEEVIPPIEEALPSQ